MMAKLGEFTGLLGGITGFLSFVRDTYSKFKGDKKETHSNIRRDILSDLDVCSESISKLDNDFIRLLNGFKNPKIITDRKFCEDHVEDTRRYFHSRNVLPEFQRSIASLKTTSENAKLRHEEYRKLVLKINHLVAKLECYREKLGRGPKTGVTQTEHFNLETLCEKAQNLNYGGGQSRISLEKMVEIVGRNEGFTDSDDIDELIGSIRALVDTLTW